jgi:hypothetical protein
MDCCREGRVEKDIWPASGEHFDYDHQFSVSIGYTDANNTLRPPWRFTENEAASGWPEGGRCLPGQWRDGMEDENSGWDPWESMSEIADKEYVEYVEPHNYEYRPADIKANGIYEEHLH